MRKAVLGIFIFLSICFLIFADDNSSSYDFESENYSTNSSSDDFNFDDINFSDINLDDIDLSSIDVNSLSSEERRLYDELVRLKNQRNSQSFDREMPPYEEEETYDSSYESDDSSDDEDDNYEDANYENNTDFEDDRDSQSGKEPNNESTNESEKTDENKSTNETVNEEVSEHPQSAETIAESTPETEVKDDSNKEKKEEQTFDFSTTNLSEMLFAYSILNASEAELQKQASAHGITSDYKNNLLKLYGITASDEMVKAYFKTSESEKKEGDTGYTFSVTSADRVEKVKQEDGNEELTLYGNVAVSFSNGSESKTLNADSMLISDDNKILIAYGDISVSDAGGSALQNIEANLLVFEWESNYLTLYSAYGGMSRGSGVQYYMNGDVIAFNNKTSETYIQNATLTTNKIKNNSNWQIDAHDIVMKGTGDIFLTAMFLKIGRVPILPLPALFMPGSSLVYNPAIGFSSSKGAFINTTYDVFGGFQDTSGSSDGGLASSFTSLFASDTNKSTVKKDGLLYVKDTTSEQTALEKWASDTSSHLTAFLDAYVNEGMFLGADAATNLFNKKLSLKLLTGIAYKPQGAVSSYSSSTYPSFRYGVYLSGSGNFSNMSVSFSLPFTSDPEFKYTYFNRITKFAFDSLWATEQKFPSTYSSSSETTLTPSLKFSMGTPSFLNSSYLNSFSLSLEASIQMAWKASYENPTEEMYSYKLGEGTLPSISMSFGGTLLNFTNNRTSTKTVAKEISKEEALVLKDRLDSMSPKKRFETELLIERALNKTESRNTTSETTDTKEEQTDGFNYIELELIGNEEKNGIGKDSYGVSIDENITNVVNITDEENANIKIGENSTPSSEQSSDEVANENNTNEGTLQDVENEENSSDIETEDNENSVTKKAARGQLPSGYSAPSATLNETKTSFWSIFDNAYIRLTYSVSEEFYNKYAATTTDEKAFGDQTLYNRTTAAFSLTGAVSPRFLTFSQTLNPQYIYSKEEKSNNTESQSFQMTGNTSVTIPYLGISWNLGMVYYKYSKTMNSLQNEPTIVESKAIWSKDFISSHNLSFSKSVWNNHLSFSISGNLPPLSSSISPTIRFSMNGFSLSASHNMDGTSLSQLKNKKTSASISYSHSLFSISSSVSYDYTKQQQNMHFLRPFQISESFSTSFSTSFLHFSQSLSYLGVSSSGINHYFSGINFSLSAWSYATLNVGLSGAYNNLQVTSTTLSLTTGDLKVSLWRGRIAIGINARASMNFNFSDVFQNSLTYSLTFLLDIKEFLSFKLSMSGGNKNFYKYVGGGTGVGAFSFTAMMEDLWKSINIFNPSGLRQTNFVLDSLNFSISHDMGDWSLSFTYTTEIIQKGNMFTWTPKYTILLQWSAIPELKVDKTIETKILGTMSKSHRKPKQ